MKKNEVLIIQVRCKNWLGLKVVGRKVKTQQFSMFFVKYRCTLMEHDVRKIFCDQNKRPFVVLMDFPS